MDPTDFDHWTRRLRDGSSRRQAIHALLIGILTTCIAAKQAAAGPGCKNFGKRCKKAKECCSGICKGKKGKRQCRAHDASGCQVGQTFYVCGGASTPCTTSASQTGGCITTTGNAGYCAAAFTCFACQRDADCEPYCGQHAACVSCAYCVTDGGTACAATSQSSCVFPP